jgi:diaminopimelate decarboxylase
MLNKLSTHLLPLTAEITVKGNLGLGGCDCLDLAKEYGTPLYVMDEETLRDNCRRYLNAFHNSYPNTEVIFASKALSVVGIAKILREEGLGIDVVSGGELYIALKAGFDPNKIYFHGNNKSPKEIIEALEANVGTFVVDNYYELDLLNTLAAERGVTQDILIRVTPGIEAHTHDFVKTGHFDSKFGFHIDRVTDVVDVIKKRKNLSFQGVHAHIGSQILDISPFSFTVEKLIELIQRIQKKNGLPVNVLNCGGGLGISYTGKDIPPAVEDYAKIITQELKYRLDKAKIPAPKLIVEPGRSIVGRAGTTLYTIGSVKRTEGVRTYAAIDGGMSDNPRVITYQAKYEALLANKISEKKTENITIAGRFCESGDILIKDLLSAKIESGDILAVFATGAYNYSMASNYNQVPRSPMVLVNNGKAKVLVRRETYADLTDTHLE